MSGGEWGGPERRDHTELRRVVREELKAANQDLEQRLTSLERKIDTWEDRAGFMRTSIILVVSVFATLAAGYEWFRNHIFLR